MRIARMQDGFFGNCGATFRGNYTALFFVHVICLYVCIC
jgi:hypothetical protein